MGQERDMSLVKYKTDVEVELSGHDIAELIHEASPEFQAQVLDILCIEWQTDPSEDFLITGSLLTQEPARNFVRAIQRRRE